MKKTTLTLAFLLFLSTFTFSQSRKVNNGWGCSVVVNSIQAQVEVPLMTGPGAQMVDADGNILTGGGRIDKSLSFSIIPKYYLSKDILLRFEFGVTNLELKANSDEKSSMEHVISNTEVSTKIYRYSPGFQWTFIRTQKLESYCGITASYISYKQLNRNFLYEHRDFVKDTLKFWGNGAEITPGGFALGLGALAGFNIYLNNRISVGAELSSSALYYKLGGETTLYETQQSLPDPSFSIASTWTNSYMGFKISKIISSFNISLWF